MNENENICPKCQSARMELKGGLVYCPNCGFEGEEKKLDVSARSPSSQTKFWFALLTPAALALLSYVLGRSSKYLGDAAMMVGMADLLIGAAASIYCGTWLAHRFFRKGEAKFIFGLIFVLGIGFVNFMILCFGCGPNIDLR